ncbi:hypothetical protein [Pseudohoeflea suaedae]|uniref:hypothetical protein n=1 Tax=Pseudohoeflea suaedae TaxID=877384 RepID=UPI001FCE97B3|nr:hypothetical protein [Pseudohoeflea suaedae]
MTGIASSAEDISLGDRPLLICDIDEVALEFVTPFMAFLISRGHELRPVSFRLTGNIFPLEGDRAVEQAQVSALLEEFFAEQDRWQHAAEAAVETLHDLSAIADIVFLTAMPPRHRAIRRRVLDTLAMPYPMIASEQPKGPAALAIHGERDQPVAFVDDIFRNLHSVRDHLPQALLVNLMAHEGFRALAPDPGDGVVTAQGWPEAGRLIRRHFSSADD